MAQRKNSTDLTELLLKCMAEPDPMLSMLEWLCAQLMEAEGLRLVGAEKNARNPFRSDYRCGYRPRRLDTRMGTIYLMIPKLRSRGYVPFFVTERKRSEAALIQVIQEAFVQGVSTRKMEKPARSLGIENLSRSQVSEMTKGLNEQVQEFRTRPLAGSRYPVAYIEKSRFGMFRRVNEFIRKPAQQQICRFLLPFEFPACYIYQFINDIKMKEQADAPS